MNMRDKGERMVITREAAWVSWVRLGEQAPEPDENEYYSKKLGGIWHAILLRPLEVAVFDKLMRREERHQQHLARLASNLMKLSIHLRPTDTLAAHQEWVCCVMGVGMYELIDLLDLADQLFLDALEA